MSTYLKYGTTDTGVDLYWTVFEPAGAPGQKFPFVIGLHPGGYHGGSAVLRPQGTDFAAAGFVFCGTEYRLAPPSREMNSPSANLADGFAPGNHVTPSQDTQSDHGHSPEQTQDVAMAVRAARAHPKCDGRVYGIGGSAGGSHVIYNLLTATEGDDKFDFGIALSPGVYDLYQSQIWAIVCGDTETCPHSAMAGYLNITDTFPAAPTGADLLTAKAASPSFVFNKTKIDGKLWVMLSNRDSRGIPTSAGYAAFSYNKDGTPAINETSVSTGFKAVCDAAGMSNSTSDVPESGNKYKFSFVDVGSQGVDHAHAFNYWPLRLDPSGGDPTTVSQAVIRWFNGAATASTDPPTITSFLPVSGFAGVTEVVITGTNFNGTIGVRFNGDDALSYVVDSDTQITAIPPIGATTGEITVRNAVDLVHSDDEFTIETPQTIEDDEDLEPRQPILNYPIGGLPPTPPGPPAAPTAVEAHASGNAGSHAGQATWIPPSDTSGATLLDYTGYLTSESGASGTVADIPGNATSVELSELELDTNYEFHIAANTLYGQSPEVVVAFTSNPRDVQTTKDQPRGSLLLFDSPINPVTGKHEVDWNPSNFWGNPRLAGARYRSSWDTIATNPLDPNDTTYRDWSDIDAYIAKCNTFGQFAGISVAAGIYCPPWIINNPRINTFENHGPDSGIMPIPWNELFLDSWISFIKEFAARYDDNDQLFYFVIGGLGQVVETVLARTVEDLGVLQTEAEDRGFGSISEAWLFAANRILFACSKAFKHTHFLVSLTRVIPDSWGSGGEGTQACYDLFAVGREASLTNFGVMNAGLNANSNTGYAPNDIINGSSSEMACGFQFGHEASDVTDFGDTCVAGVNTLKGKFLEMYKDDARAQGGDPAYEAIIDTANADMSALP